MFSNLLSQVVWGLLNRGFLWCHNSLSRDQGFHSPVARVAGAWI